MAASGIGGWMTNVLLAHFYALRAHIDAVIVQAETELGIPQGGEEQGACPKCKAPAEQVKATFSGEFHCEACGHEWTPTT